MLCRVISLVVLGWATLSPARASLIGFVDLLDAGGAVGWACVPRSGHPVAVRISAGTSLLGVFPAGVIRPDLGGLCGDGDAHGFAVFFDATMRQQFYGLHGLEVVAISREGARRRLPVSSAQASNPAWLLAGTIAGLTARRKVFGAIADPGDTAPDLELYAGGPAGQGGRLLGDYAAGKRSFGKFRFSVPVPAQDGPIFGYGVDGSGVAVPLLGGVAFGADGQAPVRIEMDARAIQGGVRSGITNTLATRWVPAGNAFGGLAGTITLGGNTAAFAEGLVTLGTTADDQADCIAKDATWPAVTPVMTRLWAAILKTGSATGTVRMPVSFALSAAIPLGAPGLGVCLASLITAGYPFLNATSARYTATVARLAAWLVPSPPAGRALPPLGLGGEFRFAQGGGGAVATYVGFRADTALVVDAIAASVSAGGVTGTPAGSPWQPPPAWLWSVDTRFVWMPAAVCARAGLAIQPTNGVLSILRNGAPAPLTLPAGGRIVFDLPLSGAGAAPVQHGAFQAFARSGGTGGPALRLAVGDCLLAVHTLEAGDTDAAGIIDFENQSTAYLRRAP